MASSQSSSGEVGRKLQDYAQSVGKGTPSDGGTSTGKGGKVSVELNGTELSREASEGKDKGRRRGRVVILVDDEDERTKWVPWALLVVLLIGVGLATFFVIQLTIRRARGEATNRQQNSSAVNLESGQLLDFSGCDALIIRLRETAQEISIGDKPTLGSQRSSWADQDLKKADKSSIPLTSSAAVGSSDILLPALSEDDLLGPVAPARMTLTGANISYAASGYELLSLGVNSNSSYVISSLDFSEYEAFKFSETLLLQDWQSGEELPVDYGLGKTFNAKEIVLSENKDVVLVIGSAVGAEPISPGPSPRIKVGNSKSQYIHPSMRPFDSTVVIKVNVKQPSLPEILDIKEYEGQFVATETDEKFGWVFIRASAHLSAESNAEDDVQDDHVMPLYRNIQVSQSSRFAAWHAVGKCTSVQQLIFSEADSPLTARVAPSFMLVSVAVSLGDNFFHEQDGGEPLLQLIALGWSSQMKPVLIVKSERASNSLDVYLTEAIAAGDSAARRGSSSQPSTSTSGNEQSTHTAIIKFNLSAGKMTFSKMSTVEGQLTFHGAMHYIAPTEHLSVLATRIQDGEATRSSLTVFNSSLTKVYNKTDQFAKREPTGILYPSQEVAFVSFAFEQPPLIQVLRTNETSQNPENSEISVQRLPTEEHVSVLKGFVLGGDKKGDQFAKHNILLVAGLKVSEGQATDENANPPVAKSPDDSNSGSSGVLQFSLYSFQEDDTSITLLGTVPITSNKVISEAFRDSRAAVLFEAPAPDGVGQSTYFALPVIIMESSTLIPNSGCDEHKGFSGTLIWRLIAEPDTPGRTPKLVLRADPVAAIPATNRCDISPDSEASWKNVVKRMQMFQDQEQDLHFSTISSCSITTVLWSDVTEAAEAAPNITETQFGVVERLNVESTDLFSGQCTDKQ